MLTRLKNDSLAERLPRTILSRTSASESRTALGAVHSRV